MRLYTREEVFESCKDIWGDSFTRQTFSKYLDSLLIESSKTTFSLIERKEILGLIEWRKSGLKLEEYQDKIFSLRKDRKRKSKK